MVREIEDGDFKKEVLERGGRVLLLAYAPWCGDCQRILPIFQDCSEGEECREVAFLKLDATRNPRTKEELRVERYPTLCLFQDGSTVARRVAEVPGEEQKAIIKELVA
jgi:thioredoxin 1